MATMEVEENEKPNLYNDILTLVYRQTKYKVITNLVFPWPLGTWRGVGNCERTTVALVGPRLLERALDTCNPVTNILGTFNCFKKLTPIISIP
jgi:hypothetical protein